MMPLFLHITIAAGFPVQDIIVVIRITFWARFAGITDILRLRCRCGHENL